MNSEQEREAFLQSNDYCLGWNAAMRSIQEALRASPAVPVAQDERELFAVWWAAIQQGALSDGTFAMLEAWCRGAWQARASLSASPPSADVPVALTDDDWQAVADELDSIIFSRVRQAIDKRLAEKQQCK